MRIENMITQVILLNFNSFLATTSVRNVWKHKRRICNLILGLKGLIAGPPRALRAPYSWNMVNLFLFGCHVTERTYASTDCTGRVGETIKRKGGVSQACLGKSTSFILDIHSMVNSHLRKQNG